MAGDLPFLIVFPGAPSPNVSTGRLEVNCTPPKHCSLLSKHASTCFLLLRQQLIPMSCMVSRFLAEISMEPTSTMFITFNGG